MKHLETLECGCSQFKSYSLLSHSFPDIISIAINAIHQRSQPTPTCHPSTGPSIHPNTPTYIPSFYVMLLPRREHHPCNVPPQHNKYNCSQSHQLYLCCSILIVNCPFSVINNKSKPKIICHSFKKKHWASQIYNIVDIVIMIQILIIHDYISLQKCTDAKYTKLCWIHWHLEELKVSWDDKYL